MVLSNTSRKCSCTFELVDVHQCNQVDFPCGCFVCLCMTSFHSLSTAAFGSGINIAWGERSFCTYFRFPEASISEKHISRLVWDIRDSRFLCVYSLHLLVHPRPAVQKDIRSLCTSFCPSSHLRASRTPQVLGVQDTLCRETRQHAPAFTLKIRKLSRELFRSVHRDEFVHQNCNTTQKNSVFPLQYQD